MSERKTIIFLHIPKTAGQTIHSELVRAVGPKAVSPVRVHTQAGPGRDQMPPGYTVYSGHLDWQALKEIPEPRFAFTVLRDPLERIASFYFFLRRQAENLSAEELEKSKNTGMRMAATMSADDYFFGGPASWQKFVVDHYHNPYCSYLATRRIRGGSEASKLEPGELLSQAKNAANKLDGVFSVDNMTRVENALQDATGLHVNLTETYVNSGPGARLERRWPKLEAAFESDISIRRLKQLVAQDQVLMSELDLI